MQTPALPRKWLLVLTAAVYLGIGILVFLKTGLDAVIWRGINELPTNNKFSISSPLEDNISDMSGAGEEGAPVLRFAVIGDYGTGGQAEADVAALVKSWNPEFIITTGDNNYPDGEASTIDQNIGQFYHEYIHPYQGGYGEGAQVNRFFPSLGNHDWVSENAQPYLDYFTLPGNERYYEHVQGPVHFFILDSDTHEPDGADANSIQAAWLQEQLMGSDAAWKIVFMHHPPYSSGLHGSIERMQWPYAPWGADVVISGHDHTYERISRDGILYFVNGLGGNSKYFFNIIPEEGSQVRYNQDYGAMLVEAGEDSIHFQFINRLGEIFDSKKLFKLKSSLYFPVIQRTP